MTNLPDDLIKRRDEIVSRFEYPFSDHGLGFIDGFNAAAAILLEEKGKLKEKLLMQMSYILDEKKCLMAVAAEALKEASNYKPEDITRYLRKTIKDLGEL